MSGSIRCRYKRPGLKPSDSHFRMERGDVHVLDHDNIKALVAQQKALEENVARLTAALTNPTNDVRDSLTGIASSTSAFRAHIDGLLNTIPTHHHPAAESATKAEEVFGTPELLEMILSFTDTRDKLHCFEVNKMWKATIEGSTTLMMPLGLVTAQEPEQRFYSSPFNMGLYRYSIGGSPAFSGLSVNYIGDEIFFVGTLIDRYVNRPVQDPRIIEFSVRIGSWRALPRVGSRCRAMLICQVPILEMEIEVQCEHCKVGLHRQILATSPTEFTVGYVLDKTAECLTTHAACTPHGDTRFAIGPRGKFSVKVELRDDDPIANERRKRVAQLEERLGN